MASLLLLPVLSLVLSLSPLPAQPAAAVGMQDAPKKVEPRAVTGHVKWTDKKLPRRRKLRMDSDPVCVQLCQGQTMYDERTVIDKAGNIQNVVVYISKGLPEKAYAPSKETVLIDQLGCRYVPHTVPFQLGQTVKIRNSDASTHNVHLISRFNGSWSVTQAKKGSIDPKTPFKKAEFAKSTALLKCDIHPWMEARLYIFDHPFFGVSDSKGRFQLNLKDLAPGEYEITAIHEKYKTAVTKLVIKAGVNPEVNFSFNKKKENSGVQSK